MSSSASRKRQSRQKLREDPEKWQIHLEKERERDKLRRVKQKEDCAQNFKKLKVGDFVEACLVGKSKKFKIFYYALV